MTFRIKTDCRCCRSEKLQDVFDVGDQPPANAFLYPEQLDRKEVTAPLTLCKCLHCGMVQLKHVVDCNELFCDYSFITGSSARMCDHFAELMAEGVHKYVPLNGLVVEIGSNDGSALASIHGGTIRKLGVDPAANLANLASDKGVRTISKFFSEQVANDIVHDHGKASLIVACNVMGHIDDLDDFCRGVKELLAPGGAFVFEVPYVRDMVASTEFDTIYHEHLSYFAISPLAELFARFGLGIVNIEHKDVHGGTIRGTVASGESPPNPTASEWIRQYESEKIDWAAFTQRCVNYRNSLVNWLVSEQELGRIVWGYGAPAKGTVRLNYCKVDTSLLTTVVDSTPMKQGRFVPGTHQAILNPTKLKEGTPDSLLVLAWNHVKEIRAKESNYIAGGGTIITPQEIYKKYTGEE